MTLDRRTALLLAGSALAATAAGPALAALLATGICEMLAQRPLWSAQAEAARRRVETLFDVRQMLRQYETLYRDCLAAARPSIWSQPEAC